MHWNSSAVSIHYKVTRIPLFTTSAHYILYSLSSHSSMLIWHSITLMMSAASLCLCVLQNCVFFLCSCARVFPRARVCLHVGKLTENSLQNNNQLYKCWKKERGRVVKEIQRGSKRTLTALIKNQTISFVLIGWFIFPREWITIKLCQWW